MGRSWEYGNYHRNSDDLSVYCDLKVGIDGNIPMKNGGRMGFNGDLKVLPFKEWPEKILSV